jgi:Mn-dependent DtxR family transcriptional regulator
MRAVSKMLQPLISKKGEGAYELSEKGVERAYLTTMQRLLMHYAQQALKMPPAEAQAMGAKLPAFTDQIIRKLDDYFDQLPQFASFIKEPNAGRLGAYIGQNFMPQLEKVKEKLLETEIPKYKAEYENPYRVPSNDLIMLYSETFSKAPPLTYKPFDPEAEAEEKLKSAELVLPGETPASAGPKPQPGEVLLSKYSSFFITARPLVFTPDTGDSSADDEGDPAGAALVPQQITFRAFIQVINTVARFIKAQDQAGYAKYYQSLPAMQQAAYTYYTFFQKEAQGQSVAWSEEIHKVMQRAQIDAGAANKLKDEVESYRKVSLSLSRALAAGQQKGMPPQLAQTLYGQLVTIFENNGNLAEKRTALKMSLLQVTQAPAKEAITSILAPQLEELQGLYGLA